ncbi:MAG: DUF1727 domain-containing protein [Candidatus Levybacteria bacterium]|nr:DUF1727 domain-containing protein [Candidatus Levybacteria bacterium]
MKNELLSLGLYHVAQLIRTTGLGHGSTWPGHIALKLNPDFIEEVIKKKNIIPIVIAGTNGKTTTARMLTTVLEKSNMSVFQNESGSNLLNGVASSIILHSTILSAQQETHAIFEVDENALTKLLKKVTPKYLVLLNLFRDQLDRYGEVRTIAMKWKETLSRLHSETEIIANGDDPLIVWICEALKQSPSYFGLAAGKKTKTEHAADSIYCPRCGKKLVYASVQFSHLGDWKCPSCGLKRPKVLSEEISLPLVGSYNQYNGLAAFLTAQILGIDKKTTLSGLSDMTPAFGRQETFQRDGRNITIFLSKNPTGMNESLRTIKELGGNYYLFLLNDRIPDGRDVSWIWDVDFEDLLQKDSHVHVSGDRAWDMSLRIKYAHPVVNHIDTYEIIERAFDDIVMGVPAGETLFILPTYSAMLEIRKILTGRKIL